VKQFRYYLGELIPATESMISNRRGTDSDRRVAVIAIGEAKRRLDAGQRFMSPQQYADRLARSVVAMCAMPDRLLGARRDG